LSVSNQFVHSTGGVDVFITSVGAENISTTVGADAEFIVKLTDGLDDTSAQQVTKTFRAANVDQITGHFEASWLASAATIYLLISTIGDGQNGAASAAFSYGGVAHSGTGPITSFSFPSLIESGDYTLSTGSSQDQLSASVVITQDLISKSVTEFLVEIVLDTDANGSATDRSTRRMKKVSVGNAGLGDTLALIASGDSTYVDGNGANAFDNGQIWDVYVQAINAGGVQQSYNYGEQTLISAAPSDLAAAVVSKNDGSFDITITQNGADTAAITEVTLKYNLDGAQQTLVIKDANTDLGWAGAVGSQTATVNIPGFTAGNVISDLKLTTFNTFSRNTDQSLDSFTFNGSANTNAQFTIETVPELKAAVTAANIAAAANDTDLIGNTSIGFNLNGVAALAALANLGGLDTNTTNADGAYVIKVLNAADDSQIGDNISLSALDSTESFDLGESYDAIKLQLEGTFGYDNTSLAQTVLTRTSDSISLVNITLTPSVAPVLAANGPDRLDLTITFPADSDNNTDFASVAAQLVIDRNGDSSKQVGLDHADLNGSSIATAVVTSNNALDGNRQTTVSFTGLNAALLGHPLSVILTSTSNGPQGASHDDSTSTSNKVILSSAAVITANLEAGTGSVVKNGAATVSSILGVDNNAQGGLSLESIFLGDGNAANSGSVTNNADARNIVFGDSGNSTTFTSSDVAITLGATDLSTVLILTAGANGNDGVMAVKGDDITAN
jgi:hypothetical protein